jgi:hypothetical protein
MTVWNVINNNHDGVGHKECVQPNDNNVDELYSDLSVVLVQPSSWDDGEGIIGGDGCLCEDSSED